jgi:hypothetical protein
MSRTGDAILDFQDGARTPAARLLAQSTEREDPEDLATFLSYSVTAALAWLRTAAEVQLTRYEADRMRDAATRLHQAADRLERLAEQQR